MNFDPHSISSLFRCPDTKSHSISIRTLKASHFRPLHKNQINADPPHCNEVIFDNPQTTTKYVSSYTRIKSSSIPHINQTNFDPNTKTKSFSTPKQKPSHFRSPHKEQVNFDHHTKTKLISMQLLKPSKFRSLH